MKPAIEGSRSHSMQQLFHLSGIVNKTQIHLYELETDFYQISYEIINVYLPHLHIQALKQISQKQRKFPFWFANILSFIIINNDYVNNY